MSALMDGQLLPPDLAQASLWPPGPDALLLVEKKEASFGIVYKTDARANNAVRVLGTFPEDSHPPILYGLAVIRNRDNAAARRFYNFLKSPNAKKIFHRFGFLTP